MGRRKRQLSRARTLALKGRVDAALASMRRLVFRRPADVDGLILYGNLLELFAAGSPDAGPAREKARRLYERAVKLQPDNPVARIDLADYYEDMGDRARALALAEEALAKLEAGAQWKAHEHETYDAAALKVHLLRCAGRADEVEPFLDALAKWAPAQAEQLREIWREQLSAG